MKRFIRKIAVGLTAAIAIISYGVLIQPSKITQEITHFKLTEKACIVQALWHEARGEKLAGLLAVASVIENRKNSSRYPADYCSVIWQDKQFSFTAKLAEDAGRAKLRGYLPSGMPFLGHTVMLGGVIFPSRYPSTNPSKILPLKINRKFEPAEVLHQIYSIADRMVNQEFNPTLDPAVLWYTTKAVSNSWTKRLRVCTEINNHRFYCSIAGRT